MLKFLKRFDLIFFYLFVISIPFEKRHVFETSFSRSEGQFIEWGSMAFYLSDIFLIAVLIFWLSRLLFARVDKTFQDSANPKNPPSFPPLGKGDKGGFFENKATKNLVTIFTIFINLFRIFSLRISLLFLSLVFLDGISVRSKKPLKLRCSPPLSWLLL